jgi:hypothetical protein
VAAEKPLRDSRGRFRKGHRKLYQHPKGFSHKTTRLRKLLHRLPSPDDELLTHESYAALQEAIADSDDLRLKFAWFKYCMEKAFGKPK